MRVDPGILLFSIVCISACVIAEGRRDLEELVISDTNAEKVSYQVEVASNDSSRRRGLMYREMLPANQGMLLDYGKPAQMAIWMKNTYIPLDIIFIDAAGMVVKVHEGAEPLSTKRIESGGRVRAVLEVNAGQVQEHGIKVGNRVRHIAFPGKPIL